MDHYKPPTMHEHYHLIWIKFHEPSENKHGIGFWRCAPDKDGFSAKALAISEENAVFPGVFWACEDVWGFGYGSIFNSDFSETEKCGEEGGWYSL